MTATEETNTMNTTTVIVSESGARSDQPHFRQIPGGRWIFNGCINASGFPTIETAEQAHAITWELRGLPRDENRKLGKDNMKLARQLNQKLEALSDGRA